MITKQVTPIGIETKIVTTTFVVEVVKEFNVYNVRYSTKKYHHFVLSNTLPF
jgi:hypothetical protein